MTNRRLLAALLVILALTLGLGAAILALTTVRVAEPGAPVDRARATLTAQGRPHGVVVEFRDGEVLPGPDTASAEVAFTVGSVSKTFTAAIAVRLAESGRLDLDSKVIEHLPWFQVGDRTLSDRITVDMLLNQTSGMSTFDGIKDLGSPGHVQNPTEERVRALAGSALLAEPGSTYIYSNMNYATLGLVLEAVTGDSYQQLLDDEVATPLGLTHTNAVGEGYGRDLECGRLPFFGFGLPFCLSYDPHGVAEGYVVSSAADLARFFEAIRSGDYLSEQSRSLMTEPEGGREYAYGLERYGDVIYHEGDVTISHADVGVQLDDGHGWVVLADQSGFLFETQAAYLVGMNGNAPSSGGYRTNALLMLALAAAAAVFIAVDLLRRRTRPRSGANGIWRIVIAVAVPVALFGSVGHLTGLGNFMPLALSVVSAPELSLVIAALSVYLLVSGVLVLARRR